MAAPRTMMMELIIIIFVMSFAFQPLRKLKFMKRRP